MKTLTQKGQAASEIMLMMPMFIVLIGATLSIGYICWQGIKVQQAANLAARIQGQERVGGGTSRNSIVTDNGVNGGGDTLPSESAVKNIVSDPGALGGLKSAPAGGVYAKFYSAVYDMFSSGEQQRLFVPAAITRVNSDEVAVVRVLRPPKILNFQIPPITLEATAYGGEDPHMYALPRWGRTATSGNGQFYKSSIQNPNGD